MTEPPVTVLMTVYNGEPYVREAIESVLSQTFENFNFVVVDNASTDNSRNTISTFIDHRLRLVALPRNIGQTAALNHGLGLIKTRWVARLDADDICLPNRLERQIDYVERHPDIGLLGTWCQYVDYEGKPVGRPGGGYYRPPTGHQEIIDQFAESNPFAHPTVMFDRELVRCVGGYPQKYRYAQDLALWISLARLARLANVPEILVKLRVHEKQASAGNLRLRCDEEMRLNRLVLSLSGLSVQAVTTGKQRLSVRILRYASAIARDGASLKSRFWALTVVARQPSAWWNDRQLRVEILRVLLPSVGFRALLRGSHTFRWWRRTFTGRRKRRDGSRG